MNISRYFVDRPIFAAVLSLLIFLAGLLALNRLPISEYPDVVPPSVVVSARFPGANPEVIAQTVAAPLEDAINGVEGMLYMSSQSTSDGSMSINVVFKIGTDPDQAQQLVQNRVSQALPRLPDIVRLFGVTTIKSSSDITMVVHLFSPKERYNVLYLSNYVTLNVRDKLLRIPGVGQAMIFGGSDYSMRVWLNPQKVAAHGLNAGDVVNAIREQNAQVAAGIIGEPPVPEGTELQLNVNTQGRLTNEAEFGDIIIRTDPDGAVTRLKDVARIELGSSGYALRSLLDNKPAVAIGIFQAPGSNALDVSNRIRATMEELKKDFPEDVDYTIVYDPTTFVRESINAVIHTLLEAIALVVLVVIVFLQTWRASIIPLIAVPISIVGTFAPMLFFGFSINALSLFGLVLAIGIVVDDAIVVVENVERNIEEGRTPKEATYQAMREVSGPIIAICLTLCAVFIPIAFISGLTGRFYQQFALTIAISTVISAFNSLTLSPALAALLLKSHAKQGEKASEHGPLGWFFRRFNHGFTTGSENYSHGVRRVLRHKGIALAVYILLIGLTLVLFRSVPEGYIPAQDKQYLIAIAQLPDASSLDRTDKVVRELSEIGMKTPGVSHSVAFTGLSINGFSTAPNAGIIFLPLDPFHERKGKTLSAGAIAGNLNMQLGSIREAFTAVFPPPAVMGLGTVGGFKMQIEDRGDLGNVQLSQVMQQIQGAAYQSKELAGVFSGFQINVPQLYVDIDRTKAKQLGIPLQNIFETLQIYLGSLYVNDFNKFGKTYQVIAQAEGEYRSKAENISELKVRSATGEMVPMGSILTVRQSYGPDRAERYNGYRSADINGGPAPGISSGQAQAAMEKIVREALPKGMSFEWTDLTYQQILAGDTSLYVFPLCILLVFLVLAALYESLSLPMAVILIVPMSMLCAMIGVWLEASDNNIFTQIGLMVLVGLACKNAILIVEFARELELKEGMSPLEAAVHSSRMRLRPILMTSFAFIMGVIPLVLATGAGSEMRHAMGIAVFSGMLGVTFFGLFLTPVFYVLLRTLSHTKLKSASITAHEPDAQEGHI